MKCRCPSDTRGHKAGKCQALTVTPDKMCQPCHDKVEQELAKPTKQLDKSKPSLTLALAFVAAALMSTPALALKGPARWLRSFWHWRENGCRLT